MIKCPHCGKSHYIVLYGTSTLVSYAREYKDGKLISKDPNITTLECMCCECNQTFQVKEDKIVD